MKINFLSCLAGSSIFEPCDPPILAGGLLKNSEFQAKSSDSGSCLASVEIRRRIRRLNVSGRIGDVRGESGLPPTPDVSLHGNERSKRANAQSRCAPARCAGQEPRGW